MGFVSSLIAPERRDFSLRDPARWFIDWVAGGAPAASGKHVNENVALTYSAVYACVRVIAETIASLPWIVYRRLPDGGKERAVSHRLYPILHDAPNPEMTRVEFMETIVGHLELWGNAYAEIQVDNSARILALWPLRPDRMMVLPLTEDRPRSYVYTLPDGSQTAFLPNEILHFRALSPNGYIGYSPIRLAREAIGLGLAAEEYGARFFSNDSRPGGVLQHPGRLSDSAAKRLKESWEDLHRNLTNKHRVAILEEGVTWQSIGIPPEDAQFLETRKFQVEEIARIFRVPLHKIQNLDRATFSNIEHQAIEFVVDTIRPRCVRLEQRVNQQLFSDAFRQTHFSEFLLDGLLRGDIKSRYEAYRSARYAGWMTTNEIRERENLNPLPGGSDLWMPSNMTNASTTTPASRFRRNMTPEEWQQAYSDDVPHWAEDLTPSTFAQQFVEDLREMGFVQSVLEIGCGNGRDSILFARAGFTVTAIDVAPGAIDLARQNAAEAGVKIDLQLANAESLPFDDGNFDALFSLSVLHASDLTKSIPETARVLAPGGLAFIYIYADTTFADGHVETYTTVDSYLDLLKNSGYEVFDFYSEQEDEFDEYGEKHRILVAKLRRIERDGVQ